MNRIRLLVGLAAFVLAITVGTGATVVQIPQQIEDVTKKTVPQL